MVNAETRSLMPRAFAASVVSSGVATTLATSSCRSAPVLVSSPRNAPVTSSGANVTPSLAGTTSGFPSTILNDASFGAVAIVLIFGARAASRTSLSSWGCSSVPTGTIDSAGAKSSGSSRTPSPASVMITAPDMAGLAKPLIARLTASLDTTGSASFVGRSTPVLSPEDRKAARTTRAAAARSTTVPRSGYVASAWPSAKVTLPSVAGTSTLSATLATAASSAARSTRTTASSSLPPVK